MSLAENCLEDAALLIAKGHFQTPATIVEHMVAKLFEGRAPKSSDTLLDAGCGAGDFIEGIILWCQKHKNPLPRITGVELDPKLGSIARNRFGEYPEVRIEERDFLATCDGEYEFIISNPPYVSILQLSEEEKRLYKPLYETARSRFDLYLLFFEKALKILKKDGRLVFITPEKYTYVETSRPLRRIMAGMQVREIEFLEENAFSGLTTYPTITIVENSPPLRETEVSYRNGTTHKATLPKNGERWLPTLNGSVNICMNHKLKDICIRVSCGVATGADEIFIKRTDTLDSYLEAFVYPTISGRELRYEDEKLSSLYSILVPYDEQGELIPFEKLGDFGKYLSQPHITARLKQRTCCRKKPWYAFHENPPMKDLLCSKILCKDIAARPYFWLDGDGLFIPRHSVYYIVPRHVSRIRDLLEYLRSDLARDWLAKNSQRAANNFIRLQSSALKELPIPERLYSS